MTTQALKSFYEQMTEHRSENRILPFIGIHAVYCLAVVLGSYASLFCGAILALHVLDAIPANSMLQMFIFQSTPIMAIGAVSAAVFLTGITGLKSAKQQDTNK